MDPATLTRLRVYGALLVVALGLYLVGRWQGAASVADAAAVRDAETGLAAGQAYRGRLDSLRRVEHQQSAGMQASRHLADSLRRLATRTDPVPIGNSPDSAAIGLWRATANAERESAHACLGALTTCQERAQTAEARNVVLEASTAGLLKLKACHVLFVQCPSRALTAVVSYGLGALTVLVVRP